MRKIIFLIITIVIIGCQSEERSEDYTIFTNTIPHGGPTISSTETNDKNFNQSVNEIKEYLETTEYKVIFDKSLAWYAMETERSFSELNKMTAHETVEYVNKLKAGKLKK